MQTRAAVLREMGRAEPYARSQPLTIETVVLDGPGDGEVLVDLAYGGLCHSDLSVINGSRPRVMPMAMGHEASGVVVQVGSSVGDLRPGDHVVCSFLPACGRCAPCATGRPALCEPAAASNGAGELLDGGRRLSAPDGEAIHHHLGVSGFAGHAVVARESLVRVDADVPLDIAAIFGCGVLTGVGAVFNAARVAPGTSVAVLGLGGVGLSAVLGARAAGAYPVIGVDVVAAKLDVALTLGADLVVRADDENAVEQIRTITRGGADTVIESVGSAAALAQAYASTARGGMTVTVGLPHPSKMLQIPAVSLVAEERTLRGSYLGSAVPRRDIPRYIDLFRAGRLPVDKLISDQLSLSDINRGFDELARGKAIRQVVNLTDV